MTRPGVVILFARTPRLGRGKRRLARDVGDVAALRFARTTLGRSLRLVARRAGWRPVVVLDPPGAVRAPGPPFAGTGVPRRPQSGRDLGRRMIAALNGSGLGPAVLVGADIPDLSPEALRRALRACRAGDVVFGPATDGGFWLIGAKRRLPRRLFDGVRWSEATTLEQAIAALPKPWRAVRVDRLADVDTGADLRRRR